MEAALSKSEKRAKVGTADRQFDYSGSQCLKALREDDVRSVLINPNIATIQTDSRFADRVYLLPINVTYVQKVIEKERPDSIMLNFGGQTALNCGVSLDSEGILDRYGITVLGTKTDGIRITEDRQLFKEAMQKSGVHVLPSAPAYSLSEARKIAKEISFPVIIRVAYTLGGKGGGVAYNEYELEEIVQRGLSLSIVHQVLIEKYVGNWKQIEYELMRDSHGNSAVVCNMENILAMRVHTGDNIVVTPSQTLNNIEYHKLRSAAQRATSQCNIVGECNIQFGLDPCSERYCAIEINARLSRSSALASKATGYPLAYMAAKICLGYALPELVNRITKVTTACFEPSLDYITLKMPRWDFQKFEHVKRRLGSTMKSVGEVMAIGKNFEEAIQKAIRMCDIDKDGLTSEGDNNEIYFPEEIEKIEQSLLHPEDDIIFTVVRALRAGITIDRINQLSHIDPWFLLCINNIIKVENQLRKSAFDESLILEAKKIGFSDRQIARCINVDEKQVRSLRDKFGIRPKIKQIDTLAAEWPAKTNYLYMTYNGEGDDVELDENKRSTIVVGAGPYRIGSSVEFDWATVNMVWSLKENGIKNVCIINCNPETVSTDYDISDRLYFEELTFERVLDIYEREKACGIVTCVGGQTANNLTPKLSKVGVRIVGTKSEDVDRAEDRAKFGKLLDTLNIKQPAWKRFSDIKEAKKFAERVGYPVLVRPSYVLSGAAMKVVWAEYQFEQFLTTATSISPEHPVVISKFIQEAAEVEVDAVSGKNGVIIGSIIEHIDNAGIHSGDAIMCIPPWRQDRKTLETIKEYSSKIGEALNIVGPYNIQYLVKNEEVYVIEANVRASRSMPFVSKFIEANLIGLSAKAMTGKDLPDSARDLWLKTAAFGIKVPQFSFMQLEGADIVLGVEMHSTGEVACFGNGFYDSLSKSYLAAGYSLPLSGSALISVGGQKNKFRLRPLISLISSLGFQIMATEHTAEFLESNFVRPVQKVYKISEPDRKPNIAQLLFERKIDFIVNIPSTVTIEKYVGMLYDEYLIRRKAVEMGVPVLTTIEGASSFIKTLEWITSFQPTVDYLKPYRSLD
ncbi:MAG TPA: carbamoyl-phosphate synthase (glutamine-hydrolyzing) large subunit [Nitrososphaeraceae archaeon]|nr:carbamoyl-phosphate synthase (glutamine-hydrolyzing) large subunit [Nitrososphaeraceae archaeon]